MSKDSTDFQYIRKEKNQTQEEASETKSGSDFKFNLEAIEERLLNKAEYVAEKKIKDYVNKDEFENKVIKIAEERTGKLIDKLDSKIDDSRIKTVEALGIFVALFTFISIEFQAFKVFEDNLQAIGGVTLIILGALLFFVVLIDFVVSNYNLSLFKVKKVSGRLPLSIVRDIAGYEEKIEFKWHHPKTWGDAFIIKFLPLFLFCIICISIGVFLLVTSSSVNLDNDLMNKKSKIETQELKVENKKDNTKIPEIKSKIDELKSHETSP